MLGLVMEVLEGCRGKEGIGPPLENKNCREQTSLLGTRNLTGKGSVSRTKELGIQTSWRNSGKLVLRPLWEKNPAVLWIIKVRGRPGPWLPVDLLPSGCWQHRGGANLRDKDRSKGGGNRPLLLSTLPPLSSVWQWPNLTEKQLAKEYGESQFAKSLAQHHRSWIKG